MTQRCVEIRSYRLKPGTRGAFDELMSDVSVPMLRRWQTDVVRHGVTAHDEVSYYLIRAYASAEDRQRPTSVVVPMDDPTIDRLRNKEKDDV